MTAVVDSSHGGADVTTPYLDAVRTALAGAPPAARDELLDDLAGHLAELAAEPDAPPLVERLGPPDAYAAELVASTGIDVGSPPPAGRPRLATVADAARRSWSGPRVVAVRRFLPELRPAWWVLRAYLGVAALAVGGSDEHDALPVPELGGNPLLGLVAVAALVPLSVALGRSGARGWNRVAGIAGAVAALAVAGTLNETRYLSDAGMYPSAPGLLVGPDGGVITNIWPYDGEGNPIDGVFLFDDTGRPIDVGDVGLGAPGAVVVPGLYPRAQVVHEYDERTGVERAVEATAPTVSVPRLPTTTSSTTTSTTGSPVNGPAAGDAPSTEGTTGATDVPPTPGPEGAPPPGS